MRRDGTTVYLTGIPRSGTTFVGKVLAADPRVGYCHEPFNWDGGLVGVDLRFDVPDVEAASAAFATINGGRARFRTAVYAEDGAVRRVAKRTVGSRSGFEYRLGRLNPFRHHWLVKDPTAPFVLAVAPDHLDTAVMLLRHPDAIVESHERLGWDASADCRRTAEVVGRLNVSPATATFFAGAWQDATVEARVAGLWRAAVEVAESSPFDDVRIVRYEDLAASPKTVIPELALAVGLPFGPQAAARLAWMTNGRQGLHPPGRTQRLRRDTAAVVNEAGRSLTTAQRRRIRELGGEVLERWYPQGPTTSRIARDQTIT